MSWAGLEVNRSLPNNNIGQHGLIKTLRAECKAISFSMSFYGTKNENDITKMAVKLFQGLPTLIVWIHTLARRQVKYENQSKMQFSFWPPSTRSWYTYTSSRNCVALSCFSWNWTVLKSRLVTDQATQLKLFGFWEMPWWNGFKEIWTRPGVSSFYGQIFRVGTKKSNFRNHH